MWQSLSTPFGSDSSMLNQNYFPVEIKSTSIVIFSLVTLRSYQYFGGTHRLYLQVSNLK
jgi:hypothetical protein